MQLLLVCSNGLCYASADGVSWAASGSHDFTASRTGRSAFYSMYYGGVISCRQQATNGRDYAKLSRDGGATWETVVPSDGGGLTCCTFAESGAIKDAIFAFDSGDVIEDRDQIQTRSKIIDGGGPSALLFYSRRSHKYLMVNKRPNNLGSILISNS